MNEYEFYNVDKLLEENAIYNIIIGPSYVGKTYKMLEYAVKRYISTDPEERTVFITRWNADIKGRHVKELFTPLVKSGAISRLTHYKYNNVYYHNRHWYLCYIDQDGTRWTDGSPFCQGISLESVKKCVNDHVVMPYIWDNTTTIIFDNFIANTGSYFDHEFLIFLNLISHICRTRTNLKVFMLGNPITKHCPYFREMGIDPNMLSPHGITLIDNGIVTTAIEMI